MYSFRDVGLYVVYVYFISTGLVCILFARTRLSNHILPDLALLFISALAPEVAMRVYLAEPCFSTRV